MCGAHLLRGSALHVLVHSDGNLPIHTEKAEVKRSAITPKTAHFDPLLIYYTHSYSCSLLSLKYSPSVLSKVVLRNEQLKQQTLDLSQCVFPVR